MLRCNELLLRGGIYAALPAVSRMAMRGWDKSSACQRASVKGGWSKLETIGVSRRQVFSGMEKQKSFREGRLLGTVCPMNLIEDSVSLHPYFKVDAGKLDAAKALLPKFVAKTATEGKMIYYEFTLNGDEIFCREAYADAEGVLAHLKSVGELLDQMLGISTLTRLEVHGPAEELEKLKGPLGDLKPSWFIYECGVRR
jgi:hypothetical protein